MEVEELLNLATESERNLDYDKNGMLLLSKENFEKIKEDYESDFKQNSINKGEDIKAFVTRIAANNRTRTPQKAKDAIVEYINNNKEKFEKDIKNGSTDIVEDILDNEYEKVKRKDKSLVSKICRYTEGETEEPKFTIFDSILKMVLPYYLDKEYDLDNYKQYVKAVNSLQTSGLNIHQIDFLLWKVYSADEIRKVICKYLIKNGIRVSNE